MTTAKQRRLVAFKDGCRYGKFGKTKAYELIAQERIRAYKMGGKTLIDLDSVDEYHGSLPRVESRASQAAELRSGTTDAPLRRLSRRSAQCCIKRTRSAQSAARL
jgi:excisionase family DNA binding protein